MWAETLLIAEKYGWEPPTLMMSYLASNVSISRADAQEIYQALERLFEKALKSPADVYPLRVDMGKLYLLKEFIEGGEFTTTCSE